MGRITDSVIESVTEIRLLCFTVSSVSVTTAENIDPRIRYASILYPSKLIITTSLPGPLIVRGEFDYLHWQQNELDVSMIEPSDKVLDKMLSSHNREESKSDVRLGFL